MGIADKGGSPGEAVIVRVNQFAFRLMLLASFLLVSGQITTLDSHSIVDGPSTYTQLMASLLATV